MYFFSLDQAIMLRVSFYRATLC